MNENIASFSYVLPEEKIAKYPLADRSSSRLLHYVNGEIDHHTFRSLPDLLPKHSLLVMNDTKVIPARIHLRKETGAKIEVFLLSPISPTHEVASAMQAMGTITWQCMIGNAKRWKLDQPIKKVLTVEERKTEVLIERVGQDEVKFSYPEDISFSEIIEAFGSLPLPPYINRQVDDKDKDSYQTVYSNAEGAVAAPTAGLHFTDEVLNEIRSKGVKTAYTTLHVSAGTFQPVSVENIKDHPMHCEQMVISKSLIDQVAEHSGPILPVGTTSMRTLESLYWFGVKLFHNEQITFSIDKNDPYVEYKEIPDREAAFKKISVHMSQMGLNSLTGETSIFIYPGYKFKACDGIITNFHLPKSTLIMLIAALIGDDWRRVYEEALKHDYRFLSYGDSSLLIP